MSLFKTNSRENSEISVETARMINCETSSQMSRKPDEMNATLTFQILQAISSAIAQKVLPRLQSSLGSQEMGRVGYTEPPSR